MSYQDYNDNNYRPRRFREEPQSNVQDTYDVDSYQGETPSERGYSAPVRQNRYPDERYYDRLQPRGNDPQNGYRQDYYAQNGYPQERYPQNGYRQNGYNGYPQNGYRRDVYDREQYSDGYSGEQQYRQRSYPERPRQSYPQYDSRQGYQQRNHYPDDRYAQSRQRQSRRQYDDDYTYSRKPAKQKTGKGTLIVRWVLVIALLVAGVMIGRTLWMNFDAAKAFSQLASLVDPSRQNYQEVAAMNSDFFGWIKIDDTVIDYPVMHTPNDPEYYLHTDFDGDYSDSGCLFMDAECYEGGNNYLIYGHHMINGSMFGSLPEYEDYDYYTNHKIVHFDTLNSVGDYEVCAVFMSQVYDDYDDVFKYYEYKSLDDEYTFNTYVANVKALSLYDTGITPVYGDKLITLSTCNYHTSDGRFVVVARKIN